MCRQIVTYKLNGKEEEGYLISAAHAQQHIGGSNIPRTYIVLVVNEKGTDKLKTIPLVDVKSFRFEEDPEKEEIRENFKKELEDIENYKIRKITDKEDSNYKKLFATQFYLEQSKSLIYTEK